MIILFFLKSTKMITRRLPVGCNLEFIDSYNKPQIWRTKNSLLVTNLKLKFSHQLFYTRKCTVSQSENLKS